MHFFFFVFLFLYGAAAPYTILYNTLGVLISLILCFQNIMHFFFFFWFYTVPRHRITIYYNTGYILSPILCLKNIMHFFFLVFLFLYGAAAPYTTTHGIFSLLFYVLRT